MMFKKTKVKLFAPYVQMDGLIEKITVHEDYECEKATHVYEKYSNRGDKLFQSTFFVGEGIRVDLYKRGRSDAVKGIFMIAKIFFYKFIIFNFFIKIYTE